jgi:hypothetical protein
MLPGVPGLTVNPQTSHGTCVRQSTIKHVNGSAVLAWIRENPVFPIPFSGAMVGASSRLWGAEVSNLPSERVIVSAPMSFAGSTQRIWRLHAPATTITQRIWRRWHPPALAAHGWAKAGYYTALVTLLVLAWLAVAMWYYLLVSLLVVVWAVVLAWYCFFGIWLVPYRLIRRSQRSAHRDAMRHRELLEQMAADRQRPQP